MSQAALNTRNSEEEVSSRRNNGTRLAGILFLLTVLTTVLVERLGRVGWMEDAQRLPLSKLVLTGERHYTVMTISGSRSWHWVSQVPL
ncbi:cell division protein FtsQ [Escherichia coli]|uniref:Cell division protein FtsQ n=1 Tax=Escherichia coli TaxID=562 RepID=A0A377E3S9_ECOLX|nr:cell division protein FtsQ [Escherichia coli]